MSRDSTSNTISGLLVLGLSISGCGGLDPERTPPSPSPGADPGLYVAPSIPTALRADWVEVVVYEVAATVESPCTAGFDPPSALASASCLEAWPLRSPGQVFLPIALDHYAELDVLVLALDSRAAEGADVAEVVASSCRRVSLPAGQDRLLTELAPRPAAGLGQRAVDATRRQACRPR